MKYFWIIVFLTWTALGKAQEHKLSSPSGHFAAIIVSDMDSALNWYSDMLSFELVKQVHLETRGIHQANLKSGSFHLELIQTPLIILPTESLSNKPQGTRMAGIFKLGFSVADFDQWLNHLEAKAARFHGQVVTDPISGKKTVLVLDPDGNRIQLFEK